MINLNAIQENQFQLLIKGSWEQWEVLEMYCKGLEVTRYLVRRMCDHTEHELTIEKLRELETKKHLKLC